MIRLARGRGGGAGRIVVGLGGCGAEAQQEYQPEECLHHAGRSGRGGRADCGRFFRSAGRAVERGNAGTEFQIGASLVYLMKQPAPESGAGWNIENDGLKTAMRSTGGGSTSRFS